MKFEAGQRVYMPLLTRTFTGTVRCDDGRNVTVDWDDGKTGHLTRDDSVCYNANRLQADRSSR